MEKFRPHGSFSLSTRPRLLVIEAVGPWNLELLQQYVVESRPYAEALGQGGRWVLLAIMRRSALFTDDAIEGLRQLVKGQTESLGRIGTSVVIEPSVEGFGIIDPVYRRVYGGVCPVKVFETEPEAVRWAYDLLGYRPPSA